MNIQIQETHSFNLPIVIKKSHYLGSGTKNLGGFNKKQDICRERNELYRAFKIYAS
jgi:hypothetical protein